MNHVYTNEFYDYIDAESMQSARDLINDGLAWMAPRSVLDVGCGRGAWLRHWLVSGITDIIGIDGDFVDRTMLHFPETGFVAADLSQPFDLGRKFDLAQSLEVAEHLPLDAAEGFVRSLCAHSDMILFSAAVPGQGGEHHVNEQPLGFWRDLFSAQSYRCFDCIRPNVADKSSIKPWYRYNALLYVRDTRVSDLPEEVRKAEIAPGDDVPDTAPLMWKVRKALVSMLPRSVVTLIARVNAWFQVQMRGGPKGG